MREDRKYGDNYCDNEQAAGEEREDSGGESIIKAETRRRKKNIRANMKCRQKRGDWFTQS